MSASTPWISDRLSAPSICTVIFAPRPENYTLSSATAPLRLSDAINYESLVDQNEFVTRKMLQNIQRLAPELQSLITEYLRDFLETSFTTLTVNLPSEIVRREPERVPGRTFPFASHLNLIGPPVEGLSFDLDDLMEEE